MLVLLAPLLISADEPLLSAESSSTLSKLNEIDLQVSGRVEAVDICRSIVGVPSPLTVVGLFVRLELSSGRYIRYG